MSQLHALLTAIHRPYAAVYADATERLAATGFVRALGGGVVAFTADDLYKTALQLSDNTVWMLTAITPTWAQIGGTPLTTEQIQDIVGAMFPDVATIDWTYDDATGVVNGVVIGAAPTGSAGGDLSGTFPNPTVAADAVTNTKLANMAANTIKGNNTGSSADPSDLSVANVQAMLATARINAQTGTTYTLQASDNGVIVTCSNAAAITVTVPSGLGAGFNCMVVQKGAGQVTFSPSSTTVNNRQSHTKTAGEKAIVTLFADVANNFYLGGDTTS